MLFVNNILIQDLACGLKLIQYKNTSTCIVVCCVQYEHKETLFLEDDVCSYEVHSYVSEDLSLLQCDAVLLNSSGHFSVAVPSSADSR